MPHRFRHTPVLLTFLLWIVLLALAWSVAFTPIRADNDCWWHVKTGLYIADHGIPEHDVFSFTAEDHRWDNHEWLTQVAMGQIWRLGDSTGFGGWRAVILWTSLMSMAAWAAVAWLAWRRVRHWGIALVVAVLAVAIGRRTLYPRPPVVSYLLFALFLWICYEVRLGRWPAKRLWVLVPATAAWSNLHGGWMAGLLALAFFAVDGFARFTLLWWRGLQNRVVAGGEIARGGRVTKDSKDSRSTGDTSDSEDLKDWPGGRFDEHVHQAFRQTRAFALALLACVVASWCNPFAWRLYLLPGRVMSDLYLVRAIGELRSPDFFYTVAFEAALLLAVAGLALIRRRPITLGGLLLFLFWGHQGVQHVRHLPMFAIASAPLLAVVGREALRDLHVSRPGRHFFLERWSPWPLAFVALLLTVYVEMNPREGVSYFSRNAALIHGQGYVEDNYPTKACDFALLADIQGRVYNRNNYAGYLIWRLAPEQAKVFTDSRFDIFGGKFLRDEELIGAGNEDPRYDGTWQELLDRYQVDWILIPVTEGLESRLEESPDWELVYCDPTWRTPWVIWIRKSEATRAMRERALRLYESLHGGPPSLS